MSDHFEDQGSRLNRAQRRAQHRRHRGRHAVGQRPVKTLLAVEKCTMQRTCELTNCTDPEAICWLRATVDVTFLPGDVGEDGAAMCDVHALAAASSFLARFSDGLSVAPVQLLNGPLDLELGLIEWMQGDRATAHVVGLFAGNSDESAA